MTWDKLSFITVTQNVRYHLPRPSVLYEFHFFFLFCVFSLSYSDHDFCVCRSFVSFTGNWLTEGFERACDDVITRSREQSWVWWMSLRFFRKEWSKISCQMPERWHMGLMAIRSRLSYLRAVPYPGQDIGPKTAREWRFPAS